MKTVFRSFLALGFAVALTGFLGPNNLAHASESLEMPVVQSFDSESEGWATMYDRYRPAREAIKNVPSSAMYDDVTPTPVSFRPGADQKLENMKQHSQPWYMAPLPEEVEESGVE